MGITQDMIERVKVAVEQVGKNRLRPIKDILDDDKDKEKVSYFQLKTCILFID